MVALINRNKRAPWLIILTNEIDYYDWLLGLANKNVVTLWWANGIDQLR